MVEKNQSRLPNRMREEERERSSVGGGKTRR
jgi:hypothetical protein